MKAYSPTRFQCASAVEAEGHLLTSIDLDGPYPAAFAGTKPGNPVAHEELARLLNNPVSGNSLP
jgi:hypothetical protein